MSKRFSLLVKLSGAVFLFTAVWMLGGSSVQAAIPLFPEPNNFGGGIPSFRRAYLENCNIGGPAVTTWVSPRNQGSETTMEVAYGTTSVDMQLNDAGAVCESTNKGYRYANWVETVGPGVNVGFVGAINQYTFSNHTSPGNYGYANGFFTYSPPGGFTRSDTYYISITARSIIENDDGTFKCVLNSAPAAHLYDWSACPSEETSFPIYITVEQPVVGTIQAGGCDIGNFVSTDRGSITTGVQAAIVGWASDADYDYTQVHVYIDGVDPNNLGALEFVGSYDANKYPRSLNGVPYAPTVGYGQPGFPAWHDWFVVPKVDLDRFADAYTHTVRVFGIGRNTDGSTNGDNREIFRTDGTNLRVGPCAPPTCTATTEPAPPEPGVPFNIILNYIYNAGARGRPITPTGSVSFNGGPTSTYAWPPSTTGGSHTFTGYVQGVNGTYTINASVRQSGVFETFCNRSDVRVASRPYVKVYGNDVLVGGRFADASNPTTCTAGPEITNTSIWAFDKKVSVGSDDYYGGASGQFGVAALDKIDSFFSAGSRNGTSITAPKPAVGLSFGNMLNNTKVTNYGGDSGLSRCIPNYYSASSQPGADVRSGSVAARTITSADGPSPNQQKAIFVDGDAYISGSINYPGVNNWANLSQIPSFYLIARGNIYIDNDVSQLDGVYIAQPDTSGNRGRIYTCTNGSSLYDPNQLAANCATKLTVTGSFIANQVKYLRTGGTVGASIPNGPAAPAQKGFAWSSIGPISGQFCTQIEEIADPNTWSDNYICAPQDYGLQFRSNGTIPGMTCMNMPQPAPYAYSWTWADNYLCWPPAQNLGLTWSTTGPVSGRYCNTYITEVGGWNPQTVLCEPLAVQTPYSATIAQLNEGPASANIAEVFNFSQELYLAPTPSILQSVVGTRGTPERPRYDSITSLPPIL